jgi:hypothetical protein
MGCQTFTTMLDIDPSRPMADDRTPAERRAGFTPLTGTCMCGQVRFEVAAPLVGALYCHCTRCQRRSGTAFSMTAATVPGSFRVVEGADLIASWRPPDGWEKLFCRACGSHLYTTDPEQPEQLSVRMGAFESDPRIRPSAHEFTAYAAAWDSILDDGLPRFPERLPVGLRPLPPAKRTRAPREGCSGG